MTNQVPALDAFDALHAHLHAAAAACGQHVACALTRGNRTPVLEIGVDRKTYTPEAYAPSTAHAKLAWSHALDGARAASQRLWAALAAHTGIAPILWDFNPRTHTAPWLRGPLLRVASDPSGAFAALHLGCLSPMPALGVPTAKLEVVRKGLLDAITAPVERARNRIAVQDIAAHDLSPYIGVAMGAFVDHGAARHLLAGCTTRLAPRWVVCEEAPRPEGLANRHDRDAAEHRRQTPSGKTDGVEKGNPRKDPQTTAWERYVVILENDRPLWLGASRVEEAHLSLDEVGSTNTRRLWKVVG